MNDESAIKMDRMHCNTLSRLDSNSALKNRRSGNDLRRQQPELAEVLGRRQKYALLNGDAEKQLEQLPAESVDLIVTSPPYYRQKDYGRVDQIGWEASIEKYIARLSRVFLNLHRVVSETGSCFVVIGDTYHNKSLQLVPQRLAIAAHEIGWTVRNDLIWEKLDAAPDNAPDRWRFSHEHILFLTRRPCGYKFDVEKIRVPYAPKTLSRWGNGQRYGGAKAAEESGPKAQRFKRGQSFRLNRNGTIPRDIIRHASARSELNHFATFPLTLIQQFISVTTARDDLVLDPFAGTATTGVAALRAGCRFIGIELNAKYGRLARKQLEQAMFRP